MEVVIVQAWVGMWGRTVESSRGKRGGAAMPTILLVENDGDVSELFRVAVTRQWPSLRVLTSAGGYPALEVARDERLVAAVINQRLADLDGLEVCRRLREFSNVPIVLIPVQVDRTTRSNALATGVNALVAPPVLLKDLIETLEPFLRAAAAPSSGTLRD